MISLRSSAWTAATPLIFTFLIIFFFSNSSAQARSWSQAQIKQIIIEESARSRHVTSALALAIAQVESDYRHDVVSSKGAVGVMQIMPATARGEFGVSRKQLFDPRINIRTGIMFMEQLIQRYRGRVDLALSHYNGGSAVGKWPNARVIPATRHYVNKVMATARRHSAYNIAMAAPRYAAPQSTQGADKTHASTRTPPHAQWREQLEVVDRWLDQTAPTDIGYIPSHARDMRQNIDALEDRLSVYRERFRDQRNRNM